uniref:Uncharacterized protein n=1 Tax=viral metagenome TaxID=1070528 RepID=A0A6C0DFT5_9ZZZZ
MSKRTYHDIVQCFEKENCKLLTSEEEYKNINKSRGKYRYIASCGHEHIVFFHVFLSRKTGVICPNCVNIRNSIKKKEQLKHDKIQHLRQELSCIEYIIDLFKENFIIKKAFDGCKADIILKPINNDNDEWVGIQVKSCKKPTRDYGFHLDNKDYSNILILCICEENKKMWGIPYELVKGQIKLTIGLKKSKYNQYEITHENYLEKINNIYNTLNKSKYETIDTPICIYQQREKEYRLFRENKLDFIQFDNNNMEGLVYDFKIGNKKVQEKVGGLCTIRKGNFIFGIVKNRGLINKKRNFVQYDKGDNDIYWLNCDNKKLFYVIPEALLVEQGYICDKKTTKKTIKVNPDSEKSCVWLKPYLFDYENINKEALLEILQK